MQNKNLINNTLAIVCARGGSKGLKGKNYIKLKNKPLIFYAIEKILKNKLRYSCLSTDSKKITNISKKLGIKSFFIRPKNLSTSNISKFKVWQHALERAEIHYKKKFKYLLDVEVTNPLTTPNDLNKFIKKFHKIKNTYDGMLCVRDSWKNPYFNILIQKNKKLYTSIECDKKIVSRQKAPKTYDHVSAMYMFHTSYIKKSKHLLDGKISTYKLPLAKSIEIDNREDYNLIKKIMI
jgi:CMP-N,N'-diacetyllegionaminic acid synthase